MCSIFSNLLWPACKRTFVTRYTTPKPATQKSPVNLAGVLNLRSMNWKLKKKCVFPVFLFLSSTWRSFRFQKWMTRQRVKRSSVTPARGPYSSSKIKIPRFFVSYCHRFSYENRFLYKFFSNKYIMERLDQGHLHPLPELPKTDISRPGIEYRPPRCETST